MPTLWNRFILFVVLVVMSLHVAVADERVRGTNRSYQPGDWITYASTRFVRDVCLGERFVYFATTGGITRYNFFSNKWDFPWTSSNGLPTNDILLVAWDANTGFLWAVTRQGISYLESATQYWNNVYYDEMDLRPEEVIASIGIGDNRTIYLVSSDGDWFSSDNTSADFDKITQPVQDDFIEWRGTKKTYRDRLPYLFMSDGYLFDERNRSIDDLRFNRYRITCWVQDRWQNLWLGTWGLGSGRGDLTTMRLDLLKFGLWNEAVDAIARDQEAFWIGGIQKTAETTGPTEWIVPDGLPQYFEQKYLTGFDNDQITSIAVDGETVWFGTRDGLTRFDRRKNIWRTYTIVDNLISNFINDILIDEKFIWVATAKGVSRIAKVTVGKDSLRISHVLYPSLGEIPVYDIDLQQNLIWMATDLGIFIYDKDTNEGGFYKGVEGPANRAAFAVSNFGGEIWFGTEEGVSAFDSIQKKWLKPPARFYKTDAEIYRILAAKEAVWVATNQGVFKYDRQHNRWTQYTRSDGLPSNLVMSLLLDGDYIWFGTDQGLTRFYWNSPYRID